MFLNGLSANTAGTAYHFVLEEIDDLGGARSTSGSLGYALDYNQTKYVSLDLSGCTFDTIPDAAFLGCTGLTSVTIPDSVTSIGNNAFQGCTGLTSVTVSPDNQTYASDEQGILYNKAKTEIVFVPEAISGSVTIPGSVTSIANSAFNGRTGLTSVTIPDSVTSIGQSAFFECTSLASVTIPDSVTSIGNYAFYYCSSLTSVTIGNSVTSIGDSVFQECSGLTSIDIPDSVTSIGIQAFSRCIGLESVTIGNSVTSIGSSAFEGCTGLTSIDIPDSVTSIGNYAFDGCHSLASVTIPNSVRSIGLRAFDGCTGLTSVTFETGSNITSANFNANSSFLGDLRTRYLATGGAGGAGTYTTTAPVSASSVWTKQD